MFIQSLNPINTNFQKNRVKFHSGKNHEGYSAFSQKTRHIPVSKNKNKVIKDSYEKNVIQTYNNGPYKRTEDNLKKISEDLDILEQKFYSAYMGIDTNNKKVTKKKFR